jgi:hypothetical protein
LDWIGMVHMLEPLTRGSAAMQFQMEIT